MKYNVGDKVKHQGVQKTVTKADDSQAHNEGSGTEYQLDGKEWAWECTLSSLPPPAEEDKEYKEVVECVSDLLQGWLDNNNIEAKYKLGYTRLIAVLKKELEGVTEETALQEAKKLFVASSYLSENYSRGTLVTMLRAAYVKGRLPQPPQSK